MFSAEDELFHQSLIQHGEWGWLLHSRQMSN